MLQHLIIQFPPYDLSSGRLPEVKNKRKFQTFSSRSGRGHSVLNHITELKTAG